jgi:ubiquinone/menaquinone biosynthesis C-methylase UbiE
MKIRGAWGRLRGEIAYMRARTWRYAEVGRFWDSVHDYDEIDHETYSYARRFTDSYALSPLAVEGTVLDICGRTGNGTLYFHERGRIGKGVCADVSEGFLRIAGNKFREKGVAAMRVLLGELPLPFKDSSFDSVLCFETVEHLPDPSGFIRELARVCRKGGGVIITTPNLLWEPVHWLAAVLDLHHSEGPHRFLGRAALRRAIEAAGLGVEIERTTVLIPGGPALLIKAGEALERLCGERVRRILALRRIFICRKE